MKKIWVELGGLLLAGTALCSCGAQRSASSGTTGEGCRVTAENTFPFALYNVLEAASDGKDNILVSPYSAAAALGILNEGAEGETAGEIRTVLGDFDWTEELRKDEGVQLSSANSAWVNARFALKDAYREKLASRENTLVRNLDFSDPASPAVVNRWCADHTAGKIQGIVDSFSPNDVLLLVNALHFKSEWQTAFTDEAPDIFHGTSGKEKVDFMYRNKYSRYVADEKARMIELPFGRGGYAMYVILPEKDMVLTEPVFRSLYAGLESQKVKLRMPAFKVEAESSLTQVLQTLGIRKAFTPKAELGGIGKGPLAVTDVAQKTYIDVNKNGCEAAAVTSVTVGLTSVRPVEPIDFKVDRPFYYLIADKEAENVLFIGRLNHIGK